MKLQVLVHIEQTELSKFKSTRKVRKQTTDGSILAGQQIRWPFEGIARGSDSQGQKANQRYDDDEQE